MNGYMNLFRFYSADRNPAEIENNLTRALAICIEHDPIFAHSFFSKIMKDVHISLEEDPAINLQVGAPSTGVEYDEVNKIYAVSLTNIAKFTQSDYDAADAAPEGKKGSILDMIFQINGNLIICEAKKYQDNCLGQLKRQVNEVQKSIKNGEDIKDKEVVYKAISWGNILSLIEEIDTASADKKSWAKSYSHLLIEHLANHLVATYPDWLEVRKLNQIKWDEAYSDTLLRKRLNVITGLVNKAESDAGNNSSNRGPDWLTFNTGWAEGLEVKGYGVSDTNKEHVINFTCWAGHKKWQSWNLLDKKDALDVISRYKEPIKVRGIEAWIELWPYIRFYYQQRDFPKINIVEGKLDTIFNQGTLNKIAHTWYRKKDKERNWDNIDTAFHLAEIQDLWEDEKGGIEDQIKDKKYPYICVSIATSVSIGFKAKDIAELESAEDGNDQNIIDFFQSVKGKMIGLIEGEE